jgi:cob(I)alamin adenosyltransferase
LTHLSSPCYINVKGYYMATGLNRGLVQLYTGNGKGKTSAALGLAFRAMGMGLRVYFVQFLKPASNPSGEMNLQKRLIPQIKIVRLSDDSFLGPVSESIRLRTMDIYNRELNKITKLMQEGDNDIFVLDELVNALHLKLVKWELVEDVVKSKPALVELVLTGQPAPLKLIQLADLVSKLEMVKHPHQQGIKPRPGIEY